MFAVELILVWIQGPYIRGAGTLMFTEELVSSTAEEEQGPPLKARIN